MKIKEFENLDVNETISMVDKMSKHLVYELLYMTDREFKKIPKSVQSKVDVIAGILNHHSKEDRDHWFTQDFPKVEQLDFFEEKKLYQNQKISNENWNDWFDVSPLDTEFQKKKKGFIF